MWWESIFPPRSRPMDGLFSLLSDSQKKAALSFEDQELQQYYHRANIDAARKARAKYSRGVNPRVKTLLEASNNKLHINQNIEN